ncbi:hypothetical protein TSTA_011010 [Talaromyces stipitatus ATCC 10500]|uniref:Alcohol dehydrogenase iron-type/glycerol dehydrogenase GldA domain-containing protein n=1 Tax=Talaromyces stipitatus (strain ATCC 10500 / CBS 375.48 / QM 6759 / NRRL 1006) TaxID=441959 RepID=B8MHK4_TALSN|nr:uncharacterized protein TSTA_011010 [Talaromyces stipitatus ATCC 10500]EED15985.1 hypothetical protein TSTA_011010 [Talaromyces stipitatus ATCC 10500]
MVVMPVPALIVLTPNFSIDGVYSKVHVYMALRTNPYLNQLEAALGDNHAGTWIGIRPHTFWDDLVPIVNDIRAKKVDIVVTLGGTSIVDGAKAITYALANNVRPVEDMRTIVNPSPDDIARQDKFLQRDGIGNAPTVPLIFIPTSLSGGEYFKFSGAPTHNEGCLPHGIGYQLGPLGVGRGHTSCIMLPAVMKWNVARASEAQNDILGQQEKLKRVFLAEESVTSVLREANIDVKTCDVGDILRAVFNKLRMPATLEVGVGRDRFGTLARNSLNDAFLPTNPVPLLEKDVDKVLEILELVAGDA